MMSKTLIGDYILATDIERKLCDLGKHPTKLPAFSVFYGEPGTGKTSVAKRFGKLFSGQTNYYPVNESGLPEKEWGEIKNNYNGSTLPIGDDDEKVLRKVYILDEFHNLPRKKQERFKTIYDDLPDDVRFIFVLNTEGNRKRLHHFLSPAMMSRCHPYCFDVPVSEVDEVVTKAQLVYQNLTMEKIKCLLPDHRLLERENRFAA